MPSLPYLEHPWVLAAWPVIIGLLCGISWWFGQVFTKTMIAALILRSAFVLAILVIASRPHVFQKASTTTTVFVMDASDSLSSAEWTAERRFVQSAIESKPKADQVGIIVFGRDSTVFMRPTSNPSAINDIPVNVDREATNLQEALQTAESIMPTDTAKRIVILSDGNENVGTAEQEEDGLNSLGVQVNYYPVGQLGSKQPQPEALVDSVNAPEQVSVAQPIPIRVAIRSNVRQKATVVLSRDGNVLQSQSVTINDGATAVVFSDHSKESGLHRYDVSMLAEKDTVQANNAAHTYVQTRGRPRVLCLTEHPGTENHGLAQALATHGIDMQEQLPSEVPSSAVALANFDAVIVSNVASDSMPLDLDQVLESQVRTSGLGLGMIGGPNGFGAGGYSDTPIETALPVFMSERVVKRREPLALVLVIEDLEEPGLVNMSIEAAKAVVGTLQFGDTIAIMDCDQGRWRVPPQGAIDKKTLQNKVTGLTDMGDPPQYDPYLQKAENYLETVHGFQKHIIFFGDGDADDPAQNLLTSIKANNISLSTIATGADASGVTELHRMSQLGGGNSYVVESDGDLPQTAVRDEKAFQRQLIVTTPTVVTGIPGSAILSGLNLQHAPELLGYDIAQCKPNVFTDIVGGPLRDPILAHWQYGLGRSFAFMSDDSSRWGARWIPWPLYSPLWSQIVRWSLRDRASRDISLFSTVSHGIAHVRANVASVRGTGPTNVETWVTSSTGQTLPITLTKTTGNEYTGTFAADQTGDYFVVANATWKSGNNSVSESGQSTLVVPYSDEYRNLNANTDLLQGLADNTHGSALESASSIYQTDVDRVVAIVDPTEGLIIASMVLFLLDVAVRKLGFEFFSQMFKRKLEPSVPLTTQVIPPRQSGRRGKSAMLTPAKTVLPNIERSSASAPPRNSLDPKTAPKSPRARSNEPIDLQRLKNKRVDDVENDAFPNARSLRKRPPH